MPKNVWDFLHRLNYQRTFTSAPMPDYDDLSPRFRIAIRIYDKWYSQARKELNNG